MKNDEFNSLKITNDFEVSNREFGQLPKVEFSFHRDNEIKIDDSANKNKTLNEQIEGNADLGETDKLEKFDKTETFSSASSSSSSASTTAQAASTSAATAATSVATAASVIAVASVSVVAGMSVMSNQNATCRWTEFYVQGDRLEYGLVLENNEEDNFIIEVSNEEYLKSNKLERGENWGSFENLSVNQVYAIVVKEDVYGGKILVDETFTTKIESRFDGFYFDKTANFEDGTFTVTLNYVDEENKFSDFVFYLEDVSRQVETRKLYANNDNIYAFPLQKTTEPQTLNAHQEGYEIDLENGLFTYSLSYKENGEQIETEKVEFTFENNYQPEPVEKTYEITWIDGEGNQIKTTVKEGEDPVYPYDNPEKNGDAQYTYEFLGWQPSIVPAYEDAVYQAQFKETVNTYTVTWCDADGAPIEVDENVPYGTEPHFDGDIPIKEATGYTYEFIGWDPEISEVSKDVTYFPLFEEKINQYKVTWMLDEDTLLKEEYYNYQETPDYGEDPVKESDNTTDYTFVGWDHDPSPIDSDTVYIAQFDPSIRYYTVEWCDANGNIIKTETVPYETYVEFDDEIPMKEQEGYNYEFIGWYPDPESTPITENTTFIPEYEEFIANYLVQWVMDDGETIIHAEYVDYNQTPTFPQETPYKEPDENGCYTFTGWDKSPSPITQETTYTAQFEHNDNPFHQVTWMQDNDILEIDYVEEGFKAVYHGEEPTMEPSDNLIFIFTGWEPDPEEPVYEDTYYFAQFAELSDDSYFESLVWDGGVNFQTGDFTVQLSYRDDMNHLDNFMLYFENGEDDPVTFSLEKTEGEQTLTFDKNPYGNGFAYDFNAEEINFYVTYERDGEQEKSEIYTLQTYNTVDYNLGPVACYYEVSKSTYMMKLALNFSDTGGYLSDPRLVLTEIDTTQTGDETGATYVFPLELLNDQYQYVDFKSNSDFPYQQMFNKAYEMSVVVTMNSTMYGTEELTWPDSSYSGTFAESEISEVINFVIMDPNLGSEAPYTFTYDFSYIDDKGVFEDAKIKIVTSNNNEFYYGLIKDNPDSQIINIANYLTSDNNLTEEEIHQQFIAGPVNIYLEYYDSVTSQEAVTILLLQGFEFI